MRSSNSNNTPGQDQGQESAKPQRRGIPQRQGHFTGVPNEIMEAIARTPLSDYESRCVHFLWRQTYGWQDPEDPEQRKKVDIISHTQWAGATGISRRRINSVLTRLLDRNIIIKQIIYQGSKRLIAWGFQSRYNEWLSPKQAIARHKVSSKEAIGEVSPKQAIVEAEVSPKQATNRAQLSPIQCRLSPRSATKVSPRSAHTKEKTNIQKKGVLPTEKEILQILKGLKGWRYDEADDVTWLRDFSQEFPDFGLVHLRAGRDYYSGWPVPKHKGGWKNRFRNWMLKKQEFERMEKPGPRGKSFEQYMKEQQEGS